jgi:hypothetical protein
MIPELIEKIDLILSNKRHYLGEEEIKTLKAERMKLENELTADNLSISEKYKSFFYSYEDIENAPETTWLIPNMIPQRAIGVLIGTSGSGKTTLVMNLCSIILNNFENVYITYIDGDMATTKIKEHGIAVLIKTYSNRFMYGGKVSNYLSDIAQNLLKDTALEQKKYPERIYLVIEDSLTLIAKKRRGFIDTDYLYKYEKLLRQHGGSSLAIHHTNKSGIFADTQQIENFADYTYLLERNEFNSSILVHPQKASRYDIKGRAYLTENRKIVKEVDYENFNITQRESQFVIYVIDALEDGKMNQSEVLSYLEKVKFFSEYKVGQKKDRTI